MILPTTWQFLKRYPYLLPFYITILLLVAVGHVCRILSQAWTWLKGHLVADEETSRRLDLVDEDITRRLNEVEAPGTPVHPCRDCLIEACNQAYGVLERWEMRQ